MIGFREAVAGSFVWGAEPSQKQGEETGKERPEERTRDHLVLEQ